MAEQNPQGSGINRRLLRASEDYISWGSWELNMDEWKFSCSPKVYEILGWPKDKAFDREELRKLLHPDDRDELMQKFNEALEQEGGFDMEMRLKRQDGSIRYIRSQANIIQDTPDGPTRLSGIMHDITDLKEKEHSLKEEIRFNEALLQTTSDGYMRISMETNEILDVNPAYCRMTGYTREEVMNMAIPDLDVDFEEQVLREKTNKIVEQGAGSFESRHQTKSGDILNVEISLTVVSKGEKEYVVAFIRDITERKEAERKLEESEQRFRSLFNNNPLAVFWFDNELNFKGANEKAVELSGFTRQELMEEGFQTFVRPEDLEEVAGYYDKALNGEPQHYQIEAINKQGAEMHVDVSMFPLYVEGEVSGVFGMAKDITEEIRARNSLERSEQRFKSLFEHNPNAVYSFDLEGNFLEANQALEELTGYSIDELVEMDFGPLVAPEDRERVWGHFQKAAAGEAQNYEAQGVRKNGEKLYVLVTNLPIYVNNEIIGVFGIAQDITESKRTARQLKESEERWQRLVENNPQPIQVLQDGKFVFINSGGAELYGVHEPEELIGKEIWPYIHPDYQEVTRNRKEKFEKEIHLDSEEVKIIREDGEERFLEVHSIPIHYDGEVAIQTVIHDITERKQHEEIIKRSLNEKKVLLQEIHHRVKNNLAVISGLLELQSMSSDDEGLEEILMESQLRIQSMAMIHEKLYQSEALSDISFDAYIKEFVDTLLTSFGYERRQVEVRFDMDSANLKINEAIPCALILNELIVNSFKYAFNGNSGSILISFKSNGSTKKLGVLDDGVGLPDDFDIMQQQSLGMSLVHTLTQQLEGELEIGAGLGGEGVSFTIRFECDY